MSILNSPNPWGMKIAGNWLPYMAWVYYFHGSLFSLDAFLLVLHDPKTECREERGVGWSYSCKMWIVIWAGLWRWLAIPIFWHDLLHNGCGTNLRILKWKRVNPSVGSFFWTGCLRLIWCTKNKTEKSFSPIGCTINVHVLYGRYGLFCSFPR